MIRTKRILTSLAIACLSASAVPAQELEDYNDFRDTNSEVATHSNSSIRELKIGDIVPDVEFQMLNYPKKTARLKDFKGKLIILDFWATWCSSCIREFPKMDSLQKQFTEIQIILVNTANTRDTKQKIIDFFKKRKTVNGQQPSQLAIAFNDTIANALFPHSLLPHYVIISPSGKLIAITSAKEITADNVDKLLTTGHSTLSQKKDINAKRLLFLNDNFSLETVSSYSFFLKGKYDGLPTGSRSRMQGDILRGKAITNTSLLTMYKLIARKILPEFDEKRLVIQTSDSTELMLTTRVKDKECWSKDNLYTYEIVVPLNDTAKLYRFMLEDLNRYSGYFGGFHTTTQKCLILICSSDFDSIQAKAKNMQIDIPDSAKARLKRLTSKSLLGHLNEYAWLNLPVLNETKVSEGVFFSWNDKVENLSDLRKNLNEHGLDFIISERDIQMFLLTKNLKD